MKYFFITILLCIQSLIVVAGEKLKSAPAPSWLEPIPIQAHQAPSEREVKGYYYVLLEEQTQVEEATTYTRVVRKIVNESGVQSCSQITVSFVPEFQQLSFHTILVRREGKVINHLDLSRIKVIQQESGLGDNIYSGVSDALIILEDLRKGDELEYAYSIKGDNPIFNNKFQDVLQIASYNPILSYSRVIVASSARKFYLKYYNDAPKPAVSVKGNNSVYRWNDMYVPAYNTAGITPSWFTDYKYVEISEYANWNEVARWAYGVLNGYNHTLPEELKRMISSWNAEGSGDHAFFAEQATRFVQDQIRYQGMEIGPYTHRPYAPSEVFNKRYGDCKDKALLLVCILRSQQIPAWLCLVNTGWAAHLTDHLPGANMFNHAIVKAMINGKLVWIDATIPQQRGPILSNYIPAYGKGLVVAENTNTPETIMPTETGSVTIEEAFDIIEKPDATVKLSVTSIFNKHSADYFRSSRSANSLKDIEKGYEDYYERLYEGTKLAGAVEIEDDTIDNRIQTLEQYNITKFWKEKSKGIYQCEVNAKTIFDRLTNPVNVGNDDRPLALAYPSHIRQTLLLNMETKWTINDEAFEIKTEEYFFSFNPIKFENQIKLEYTFITYKDHIPADHVEQYKKDYAKMEEHLSYRFTKDFSKSGMTASSGASGGRLNYMVVLLGIAGFAGAVFLMLHFNRKSVPVDDFDRFQDYSIGGWLVLLAIVLFVKLGLYVYNFATVDYFSTHIWTVTTDSGSSSIQAVFLLELLMAILGLVFSATLLFWFFKKRDIFPKMLITLAIIELSFGGIELVYALCVQSDIMSFLPTFTRDSGNAFFRSIMFLAIWGGAISRSPRARYTFTRPARGVDTPFTGPTYRDNNDKDAESLSDPPEMINAPS